VPSKIVIYLTVVSLTTRHARVTPLTRGQQALPAIQQRERASNQLGLEENIGEIAANDFCEQRERGITARLRDLPYGPGL
jgi:hypothetical protein